MYFERVDCDRGVKFVISNLEDGRKKELFSLKNILETEYSEGRWMRFLFDFAELKTYFSNLEKFRMDTYFHMVPTFEARSPIASDIFER